jgi:hypothetical protein
MTKREFIKTSSGFVAFAGMLRQQPSVTADQAKEIYRRGIIIDALATPESMNVPWPPSGPLIPDQIRASAESGITAVNATVSANFEGTVRARRAMASDQAVRNTLDMSTIAGW